MRWGKLQKPKFFSNLYVEKSQKPKIIFLKTIVENLQQQKTFIFFEILKNLYLFSSSFKIVNNLGV